jgi:hypothetical protein
MKEVPRAARRASGVSEIACRAMPAFFPEA